MKKLFEILKDRINNKKATMLVTVIESQGSVPRGKGAYMLVGEEGRIYGTVGGGNLEYQTILKSLEIIKSKKNFIYNYDLSNISASELGMICGGSAKVLFCYVDDSYVELVNEVINNFNMNKKFKLLFPLEEGRIRLIYNNEKYDNYYEDKFCYDGMVYIFGGGHVARECVPLLTHLGFRCTVIEDRAEFADKNIFPNAYNIILADFNNISVDVYERDYILIMTRGHIFDKDCERFALNTKAHYIGVIGSRTKARLVRESLKSEGFSDESLDRIITPVGLDISSETPAEIAVSIAAQLIKVRAESYR